VYSCHLKKRAREIQDAGDRLVRIEDILRFQCRGRARASAKVMSDCRLRKKQFKLLISRQIRSRTKGKRAAGVEARRHGANSFAAFENSRSAAAGGFGSPWITAINGFSSLSMWSWQDIDAIKGAIWVCRFVMAEHSADCICSSGKAISLPPAGSSMRGTALASEFDKEICILSSFVLK
jgi:hypothetical protein